MANFFNNRPVHQSQNCTVKPSVEPVPLDYLKMQCRVDSDITTEDALITSMGRTARKACEKYIKRAFITQRWQFNLDAFPLWHGWNLCGSAITLVRPPIQSIVSLQYLDASGVLQTVDPSLYTLDNISEPGRLVRNGGQSWPSTGFGFPNAVKVVTVNGYGDDPSDVPEEAIQAIAMHTVWQFRNRGDQDSATNPPAAIWALLDNLSYGGGW